MNWFTAFIVFLVALVSVTPQIVVGFKSKDKAKSNPIVDAKLVMTLKSDDVLIRTTRGSESSSSTMTEAKTNADTLESKSNNGDNKRSKHGSNRKFNRNQEFNQSVGGGRKSNTEKKSQSSGERQQSTKRQHGGGGNGHHKQQQLLKSQQHQEHQHSQEAKHKLNLKNEDQEFGIPKTQSTCRYTKSPWSECDRKTNTHSRTLSLKKGDSNCLPTRTIQKKCKKSCRYEKGAWSECKDGEMIRTDKLKASLTNGSSSSPASNSSCESVRTINRKCNPERNSRKSSKAQQNNNNGRKADKKERKNKDAKHQPA